MRALIERQITGHTNDIQNNYPLHYSENKGKKPYKNEIILIKIVNVFSSTGTLKGESRDINRGMMMFSGTSPGDSENPCFKTSRG